MLTLAIDPGLTGAVAALNADGSFRGVADLPVVRDRSLAWIDGQRLVEVLRDLRAGEPARVLVERVSSMPGQGVASSFAFGVTLGSILAAVQVLQLPLELITAAQWKRALGLSREKRASLDRARLLFPTAELTLAKHDGRAEALLLAHWGINRSAT